MQQKVKQLPEGHTATLPQGPDVKARYMWRCGPRPEKTNFPELNAQPVIPKVRGAPCLSQFALQIWFWTCSAL